MAIPTEGETHPLRQRSRRAGWLIVAFAAVLVGYPLGFLLIPMSPDLDVWTWSYVALILVALGAAAMFMRAGLGDRRGRVG